MAAGLKVSGNHGGMPCIDISEFLGAIGTDVVNTVRYAKETRGARVKLVFIPHEELIKAVKSVSGTFGMPFVPVVSGIPCQFSPGNDVRVACVADDNTNFEQKGKTHQEVIH